MDGNLYLKVFMLFEIIIEEDENIIAFVWIIIIIN